MISYQLALKLKEAGFPQTGRGSWFISEYEQSRQAEYITLFEGKELLAYEPTLSELIEVCVQSPKIDFAMFHFGDTWVCGDRAEYEQDWITRAEGPTPEEAVANLYLAIHEKVA